MNTIYAIFLCWYGINQPCTGVIPWDETTSNHPSASTCKAKAMEMNDANGGTVEPGAALPYYACMSRSVPAWNLAR
jgi:hypothetical protein